MAIFHCTPLTSAQASIQWDAVDVHYTLQKYFADHVFQGVLPHWTPYVFSGFPFLSDPQVGAWYPLNWPFFAIGITPQAIQMELALHAFIAASGAYFLAWWMLRRAEPALMAGVAYAFSGFFAGHSSHVGMFQSAAWLPWILLGIDVSLRQPGLAWPALTGLGAGIMILAGHFQSAIYIALVCALYIVWLAIDARPAWTRVLAVTSIVAVVGVLVSGVMAVPGLRLLAASVRSGSDFSASNNGPLVPSSLATLLLPNALGAVLGDYHGPGDITQYYFYGGFLLLPLAVWGLVRGAKNRVPGLAILLPALWYGFGPAGGLYRVLSKLPGLGSVKAPVHIWFVVALGLALLAAGGLAALGKWGSRAVMLALALVLFADLAYWNSFVNPLAYARTSFEELYGSRLRIFEQRIGRQLPSGTRFYAPYSSSSFGPQNHPMDARVEATYGYNPLELRSYHEYMGTATADPKLLDVLGASFRLDAAKGSVTSFAGVLPRATFPGSDASATAQVVEHGEGFYRIRYSARSAGLLRVADAWYPGWEAATGGSKLAVVPVDGALIGVQAPAGEGEIVLRFRTPGLAMGALCSSIGWLAGVGLAIAGKNLRRGSATRLY